MFTMPNWLHDNLSKIKDALFKTRKDLPWQVSTIDDSLIEVNKDFYNNLLEQFIKADIGIALSEKIVFDLTKEMSYGKVNKHDLHNKMKETIKNQIKIPLSHLPSLSSHLNIYLIAGVNGSGKTTTIGKLANRFKGEGFKVLIVAADTFRAAAGNQLSIWAKKADVEIFSPSEIKKPDAVVFSAIEKAQKEGYNLLLIDTAGRLHSQINLMDELKKINQVIGKKRDNAKIEKLIVLDATIGQNAISQAELFSKAIDLTGIILAKLDSSSKGGVILNIMSKLNLPVKFIGTGENIGDVAEFNLDEYLEALIT